jgi:hypothetical protein
MTTLLIANVLIALATGARAADACANAGILGAVTGIVHVVPYAGTVVAAVAVGVATFVKPAASATRSLR